MYVCFWGGEWQNHLSTGYASMLHLFSLAFSVPEGQEELTMCILLVLKLSVLN